MSSVTNVSVYSFENLKDIDFFLPEKCRAMTPVHDYKLDVTLRIIESMVNILPLQSKESLEEFLDNIGNVISREFGDYFQEQEVDESEIKKSLISYGREIYGLIETAISGLMGKMRRMGFPIVSFIGVASENPMDVGSVGISFAISRDRYEAGLLKQPQDIVMNVLWRIK